MIRSVISPRFLPWSSRNPLAGAVVFAALSVAGCGDFCVSGFFNGGFQTNTASPAPACTLPKTKGVVRTAMFRLPSCETCTSSARVEHLYVTLTGVQLHPSAIADQSSPDWVEVAPQLTNQPRQVDLIGGSVPELLEADAVIPATSYRQVRLEFLPDSPGDGGELLPKRECGTTLRNCIVMGDGRTNPILWPGGVPELVIKAEGLEGGALVVVPDEMTSLRLSLEPQQVFASSASEPWAARVVLVGRASTCALTNRCDQLTRD